MSYQVLAIKDLSIGVFDGPHATPSLHENGSAIFLGIPNITESGALNLQSARWVAEADIERWTKRVKPQAGDIVFTYEATLNRYAIIPPDISCCLGRRTALVRPNEKTVRHRYLFYYFFTPEWRKQVEANTLLGATVDRIPLTKFPEFVVRLPALKIQDQVVEIVGTYDDLIETNRRRIALLEESARLLYREWFVNLRFPGHERVKIVDGVPDGWKQCSLEDIAILNYGKSLKDSDRIAGDVPVFGSSGIVGSHNAPLVKGPCIIVGRKGNVGSVFYSKEDCFPIDTVFYTASSQVNYYLYLLLPTLNFISSDSAVPGLNRNYAYGLPVVRPSAEVLNQFEMRASLMFDQIDILKLQNRKLAEARDNLLPKLMSGAIPV